MPSWLWPGPCRAAPPYRGLCGPHLSRRFTGRTANGATDAFQIYRQPEDGRRPRPLPPAIDPRARRRGDRVTERLQRRAVLGLAFGAGLAPGFATKAAGEPIKAFRLCMIVPSRPLPGTRAFEEQLRQFGYEEGRNL